jgi:hypothetical protein
MKSYFDEDYWRVEAYASELAERDREERELEADQIADFYAGDSPELTAFYDETTPDAPGGRYVMPAEPIHFGMELSTTELLARMSTRGRRTKRVRRAA